MFVHLRLHSEYSVADGIVRGFSPLGTSVGHGQTSAFAWGQLVSGNYFSFFGARLVQLQGVDPDEYAEMAAAEGSIDVILPATRGEILDRNGRILAYSVDAETIYAIPSEVADPAAAVDQERAVQRLALEVEQGVHLTDEGLCHQYVEWYLKHRE